VLKIILEVGETRESRLNPNDDASNREITIRVEPHPDQFLHPDCSLPVTTQATILDT
jgi:hypothetical protein